MQKDIHYFKIMEPMRYYNNDDNSNKKRVDMVNNKDNLYVATEKHDGEFSVCIHYEVGKNLIRTRSISKVTGEYGDITAKLPHLVEEMDKWPNNTVVLAEICWDKYGTTVNTVGTILRCLPAKAVERQKENKLKGLMFDILMWDGEDFTQVPYIDRLEKLSLFNSTFPSVWFKMTRVFENEFAAAADDIIEAGGEGVVIQLKTNPYMPGTRTAWKTLKLKQALPHMELKVINTIEPNKFYAGDYSAIWQYKVIEDGCEILVTKPYAMGWKNGVTVDFNGVAVEVTSGLTDEDREWLATDEARKQIEAGELYAEVKAMAVNSQNSLRHPSLVRLRSDM